MSLFAFDDDKSLGGVTSVDTGNVIVQIADSERIRHLQVNHLVVLRSGKAGQHLVGIITKIMRKGLITPSTEGMDGEITEDSTIVENIIRVALIGTLRNVSMILRHPGPEITVASVRSEPPLGVD